MRLERLYSNDPKLFTPIVFNDGLSAIVAEIRLPENRDIDTHNLGKTTVGSLLDFCLLKGKDPDFFLFKHPTRFSGLTFFLEVSLPGGGFLTIRRAVDPGSRIDFLRSDTPVHSAVLLPDDEWDQVDVPFERALTFLDGVLEIDALAPWRFRKLVGYLIRTQQDYQDVFQLGKFSGKHQDWKPFVAHLLGAQSGSVKELYEKKEERDKTDSDLKVLVREWGQDETDPSLVEGLLAAKARSIADKQQTLSDLNFGGEDQRAVADLVDDLDDQIVHLNDELYRLTHLEQRLADSLQSRKIAFDPDAARKLFDEAGIAFAGQIKIDFEQLIEFNEAITRERAEALADQRVSTQARIAEIDAALTDLNQQRSRSIAYLHETDALAKYKEISRELSALQAEQAVLEQRREAASSLTELRRKRRVLNQEFDDLQTQVEDELATLHSDDDSRFGQIRGYFADIISTVLGEQAILSMGLNNAGGIDFRAELVGDSGLATSGDKGTSYRKLLCIAFDLAVLRSYLDVPFPRFVYLDGALEQLEPRKQANLIGVFREYAGAGVQPVISLLDSDLPAPLDSDSETLQAGEVVLTLHDEGDDGRLFKMPEW